MKRLKAALPSQNSLHTMTIFIKRSSYFVSPIGAMHSNMFRNIFQRSRHFMLYAFLMGGMVFLLKWLQWKYLVADYSVELYVGLVAVTFTGLGLWIATHLSQPKIQKVFIEKEIYIPQSQHLNEAELSKLHLTSREHDVLKLIAEGCSNAEIAEKLFLSISTVKTHVSSLFVKMDVKSRTQAIQKANRLGITR